MAASLGDKAAAPIRPSTSAPVPWFRAVRTQTGTVLVGPEDCSGPHVRPCERSGNAGFRCHGYREAREGQTVHTRLDHGSLLDGAFTRDGQGRAGTLVLFSHL